jgi:hypothetical protein
MSCAASVQATDAYKELNRAFPGSTTIESDACNRIEFCPDNTCEAFEAGKVGPERLMEFVYLYVYAFSDYYVLTKWRSEKAAREVASSILTAPRYILSSPRTFHRPRTWALQLRALARA